MKNINIQIAAFGLLIISIGFQVMDLQVVVVNTIAGAIIATMGLLILYASIKKTNKT
ncbi:hypothetical protein ES703_77196 [subsurface metagenome]